MRDDDHVREAMRMCGDQIVKWRTEGKEKATGEDICRRCDTGKGSQSVPNSGHHVLLKSFVEQTCKHSLQPWTTDGQEGMDKWSGILQVS